MMKDWRGTRPYLNSKNTRDRGSEAESLLMILIEWFVLAQPHSSCATIQKTQYYPIVSQVLERAKRDIVPPSLS